MEMLSGKPTTPLHIKKNVLFQSRKEETEREIGNERPEAKVQEVLL